MVLQAHFLDVGNGDCTILQLPDNTTTIVDVRNARIRTREASQEFVNPIQYLKSLAIDSVHRYIQTHPDMDHMDGLADLLQMYAPNNFWDVENNKTIDDFQMGYRELDWDAYQAARKNAKHFYRGDVARPNGDGDYVYSLYVVSPAKRLVADANETEAWNAMSYVLLLDYAGFKLLLGGDTTDSVWQQIFESTRKEAWLRSALSEVTVFKVSHHGLDSSYCGPDVLSLTSPRKLIISAEEPSGENSAYDKYYAWLKNHGRDPKTDLLATSKSTILLDSDDDPKGKYNVRYAD